MFLNLLIGKPAQIEMPQNIEKTLNAAGALAPPRGFIISPFGIGTANGSQQGVAASDTVASFDQTKSSDNVSTIIHLIKQAAEFSFNKL